jgi:hypothetical protein
MKHHADPALLFLTAGSGNGPRGTAPAYASGCRHIVDTHVRPGLADGAGGGFRRVWFQLPFGRGDVGDPKMMSFRGEIRARRETPFLVNEFLEAWRAVIAAGNEVTFYLGSAKLSMPRLHDSHPAAFLREVAECINLVSQLSLNAREFVRVGHDAINDAGNAGTLEWMLVELLDKLGMRQLIEGPPRPDQPHQVRFDGAITESQYQLWLRQGKPGWFDPDKCEGEVVRLLDHAAAPPDICGWALEVAQQEFPGETPQEQANRGQQVRWRRGNEWVIPWADQVAEEGFSFTMDKSYMASNAGGAVSAERWRR